MSYIEPEKLPKGHMHGYGRGARWSIVPIENCPPCLEREESVVKLREKYRSPAAGTNSPGTCPPDASEAVASIATREETAPTCLSKTKVMAAARNAFICALLLGMFIGLVLGSFLTPDERVTGWMSSGAVQEVIR